MNPADTDVEWEKWGKKDPYFGVLTDEKFRLANLTEETKSEFFENGRRHTEHVLQACRKCFDASFNPQRILDFGCGVGRLVVPFAADAREVVGVDISVSMLEEARRNCRQRGLENATFVQSDDALSQVQGEFDLIHSCIVLQHINPERGIRILARMLEHLSPGGMGAIQVTYGRRNQIPGAIDQQAATAPPHPLRKLASQFNQQLRKSLQKTPPQKDPDMQMNLYDLNTIFSLIQHGGADRLHAEFTDDSQVLGVFLFFQKRRQAD